MLEAIKTAFPQATINDCLQTWTDAPFFIYDHETDRRCYAHNDSDGIAHFTVTNDQTRSVHFLAIDKCLLMDSDENLRCDCAVFDEQTVCFIEIKTTESEKERRRTKLRRKAMEQLKATIVYFKNQAVFDSADIEAYVTLLAESEGRPRNRTNLAAEIEEFEEMGVRLFYANAKAFF